MRLEGQTNTLNSMLVDALFENDAEFAACIVPHPLDTHVQITITHEDPKQCLLNSLKDVEDDIDKMIRDVDAHVIQKEIAAEIDAMSE